MNLRVPYYYRPPLPWWASGLGADLKLFLLGPIALCTQSPLHPETHLVVIYFISIPIQESLCEGRDSDGFFSVHDPTRARHRGIVQRRKDGLKKYSLYQRWMKTTREEKEWIKPSSKPRRRAAALRCQGHQARERTQPGGVQPGRQHRGAGGAGRNGRDAGNSFTRWMLWSWLVVWSLFLICSLRPLWQFLKLGLRHPFSDKETEAQRSVGKYPGPSVREQETEGSAAGCFDSRLLLFPFAGAMTLDPPTPPTHSRLTRGAWIMQALGWRVRSGGWQPLTQQA